MKLWLDFETYSPVPIRHGLYRYVEACEPIVLAWAIDDGPAQVIDLTAKKADLSRYEWPQDQPDEVIAHNAMFDRNVFARSGVHIPLEKWRCTMVQAMSHALPGGLDELCQVLQIPQDKAKVKEGKELVKLFCSPKNGERARPEDYPEHWARFLEYARMDVEAMRAVHAKLPSWNYPNAELALWHLDQRINDRGFAVDLDLAEAAIAAVDREQLRLADRVLDLTKGTVGAATQRDRLLEHLMEEHGVDLPDLQASTIERRLADPDMPEGLRELLTIRLDSATTSTAKYRALVNAATDGRLRGSLQFAGAGRTGRWSGRTFQPQNLPRPSMDVTEDDIDAIKSGAADLVFPSVMAATSSAIRGCIVAPPGRKLVVADLSNIEGRIQAWLAGEDWKLEAFRAYDAGQGPDLYKLAYSKSFGVRVEDVTKVQRQVGKVQELALGYQGGVGAFVTFAAVYGIDLDLLALEAWSRIPEDLITPAISMLAWHRDKGRDPAAQLGLSDNTWIVCQSFVLGWRQGHAAISSLWKPLEEECLAAIDSPGVTRELGRLRIRRDGAWLRVQLPSGRALCYPDPKIVDGSITYMGRNQYSRKWQRLKTYGGKLFENACQALACHVLKDSMLAIEAAGFDIVLTVHDEVICEVPDGAALDHRELANLMATPPTWAPDLPLAAAGYETHRYRKE